MSDAEWLAQLGRFGLVKPSIILPQDLRELRRVSRYRQKLAHILAGEKNRLHKILDDAGIKLGAVAADSHGVSAQAMIEGLIAGTPIEARPDLAKGRCVTNGRSWNRPWTGSCRLATGSCRGLFNTTFTPGK